MTKGSNNVKNGANKMAEALLKELAKAVEVGEPEETETLARKALELGINPIDVVEKGLSPGILTVGEKFGQREMFLHDLMLGAEAMKAGMEVVLPEIRHRKLQVQYIGRVVLGTVEGDVHDIGKSLVEAILVANGFEVIDLGIDVPAETFVEKVMELKPDVLGLSALLSTTKIEQGRVVKALRKASLRDCVKVIIGGAAVDQAWVKEIGADAYGRDADDAVRIVKSLINKD